MDLIPATEKVQVVILISAYTEWQAVRKHFSAATYQKSPFGEWFQSSLPMGTSSCSAVFLHGGWGKIAAAASTQYAIDHWNPALLINLGTCGGFEGEIERGMVLLVEQTLVYDIVEQMSDPDNAIVHYTTKIDLSWLSEPYPMQVYRALLVSADRDLVVEEISHLKAKYGAIAGDWESGAIAYVATRNQKPCLILRGVTDLVGSRGDDTYGNFDLFVERATEIMDKLMDALPSWLVKAEHLFCEVGT